MITRGQHWIMSPTGIKIQQKGIYDLKDLLKTIQTFFEEKRYTFQLSETQDKAKDKGYELIIGLKSDRDVDDYVRFHIDIHMLIIEMEKVKVKNKNLDRGNMDINFKAYLYLDYKNRWNKNFMSRFLNLIYNNYIIKIKIKTEYEAKLYIDLIELHNLVKDRLGLYTHYYGS